MTAETVTFVPTAMLKALEADAEAACVAAQIVTPRIDGAINWADLHCVEAGLCRTSAGDEYLYVCIEECDPHQRALYEFIKGELSGAGWDGVDIRFEW